MNIQQVKGEVGDGEEDITSDSLSKYEKAAAALGVALKEVRNGAVALRDPMVVLDELATAFNKEADDSVKKANLISAVGGKYRGNQLSALLSQWDTYKEILETYRSDAAIGSAAMEAEKSANNWTGSINQLKNSWAKLVNEFIKSDTAISTIQSLNTAVQNLTDSSVMDGLKTLATIFTSLVQLFGKASSTFGTLPTLIATISSIKTLTGGKPFIFGLEELDKGAKKLTLFGKGLNDVSGGFLKAKAGALAARAGVVALNAALSIGFSLAVGAAVSWITKLINKEKEAAEEAERLRVEREQRLNNTVSEIKAYEEETKNIQDLVGQYIKLASTTENLSTAKDSLLPIQEQIVEKYGLEADAIDLVNGKLEDNIGLLLEQEKRRNESWLTDNRQTIKDAEEFFGQSLSLSTFKIDTLTDKSDTVKKAAVTEANIFYKSLKDALEEQNVSDLFTYNEDVIEKQINNQAAKDLRYNISLKEGLDAEQTKRAIDAYVDAYKQLIEQKGSVADYFDLEGDRQDHVLGVLKQVSDYYDTIQTKQQMLSESESLEALLSGDDLKTYQDTVKQLTELSQTINDATATPAKRQGARQSLEEQEAVIRNLIEEYPALEDIATATLNNIGLTASGVAADEEQIYRDFLESLDNVHKGAMENINKIESAMVKLIKGEGLDHNSAWEILKLDTDKVLKPVIDSSGKYRFELDNIVALKDQIITKNKEIVMQDYNEIKSKKQLVDSELELIKLEFERTNIAIRGQSGGNSRPSESLVKQQDEQRKRIDELTRSSKAYADELERDSVLIREYNAHMGDLSGTTVVLQAQLDKLKKSQEDMKKQLDKLNKSADNLLKAQEYKIDQIIDKFQDEKDALEENKELLEEQLDTLEQQKQQIEDILKNYDDVADVISATVKDQVDEIKKNQDEVEKYYNDLIDKLKDENSERKDALDYAEKLAALENAKKNKVRVYGAATGWGYAVDRDALAKAQEALKQADDDKAIKELEKERDKRVKAYDDQIKGFEAYADEWSGIKDLLDREEKERLADELLGSEWREKIRNKDVKILNKFKNEYRSYNNQLSNLVNGEITTLKKSIESVDSEIKAKQKTIDTWNKYKKSVQDAATAAKNANEDYMKILDQVTINEASDLKARDNNLNAFKNHYIAYMNAISNKSKLIDDTTNKIESLTNQIAELSNDGTPAMDGLIDYLTSSIETIALALDAIGSTFADSALAVINGKSYRGRAADIVRRLRGYKDGGSVDFTGMTMVHGTPNHSETVFNASQSKELYDMVKTGKFATQIENRVMQGLNRAFKPPTPTSNSTAVNISNMTIKADNPQQFHSQFMKEIHTYMDLKLNESYVK